jgi:multicomponent Na+:H+ antiporter subunit D
MDVIYSPMPFMALLTSAVAVVLIACSYKRPNLREFWTIAAGVAKFLIVLSMLPEVLAGRVIEFSLLEVAPGLEIAFRADAMGMLFALTASFLWIVTSFYSIGYVRSTNEKKQTRFFMAFAGALSAAIGVAFAANMFTLFIFYEIITFCTFPLVAHKETKEALSGARKYIVYLLGTSLAFQLFAIFLTYSLAGTLDFVPGGILAGTGSKALLTVIFILFMAGITKAAMMPFHSWLPAAMVAPTPASALLHAVAVVKAGVFTVVKVVLFIFGVDLLKELGLGTALMYFASFTIITASIVALKQDNLKKRLAYSTISQLSYIVFAVALLSPSGITGATLHIVIHAFGKITLFFAAGAIYVAHHKTKVSELDGIGYTMPFTMIAFTLAALSMIGVPPLGGFISKWYMFSGAIEAKHIPIIIMLAVSTVLNAGYFLPIIYAAFFKKPKHADVSGGIVTGVHEAPAFMVVPLVLTSIGALALFFVPTIFLDLARIVVASVTGGG